MKKIYFLLITLFLLNNVKSQILENVPGVISQPTNISIAKFNSFVDSSTANRGMLKITSINLTNHTVGYSSTDRWPNGTWFHGYYERGDFWDMQGPTTINCTHVVTGYTGCHPLHRINDKMIRAHIHANHRYPYQGQFSYNDNIQKIIDGINYMIDQQQTPLLDPVEDGGFTWWKYRPDQNTPNTNEDRNQNFTHAYETSHALRAMCEAYMYFQNYNIAYSRMNDLYNAIIKAADNLEKKEHRDEPEPYTPACDLSNSNFRGLALWALAGAYKVTHDTKYFYKAKAICEQLMLNQQTGGGLADGMWFTGGSSNDNDGCGNAVYHDTFIFYHCIILRGMVEMMDIAPQATIDEATWKITLIVQIKKAVNHMINYRVAFYDNPSLNIQRGMLRTTWLATNGGTTCGNWAYYYYEEVLETISMLTLYSNYQGYFSCDERKSLRNLLLVLGKEAHSNPSGYLENFVQYAYYADYLYAFDHNRRIYPTFENNILAGNCNGIVPVEHSPSAQAFIAIPTPAYDNINFIAIKTNTKISSIEIRKIDNLGIGKNIFVNPPKEKVTVPIHELPMGYYGVKIIDNHNEINNLKFLKQ